jgi:hypothetical protein
VRREHRARESRCPARALPATCVSPPTGTLVRLTAPTCSEWAGLPRASVTRRVAPCPGAGVESLRGHNRGGCGVAEHRLLLAEPLHESTATGIWISHRTMTRSAASLPVSPTTGSLHARRQRLRDDHLGRATILPANGVETLASVGPSGSVVTLPLVRAVGVDQRRSPALADIIGARRVRTAVMISSGSIPCR